MFIEYPALGDLLPKDYAALSLEGTKYIDMQSVHHSGQDQVHYKCVDFGLRSCCFKVKCARGVGLRGVPRSCD